MTDKIDPLKIEIPLPIMTPRLCIEAVDERHVDAQIDALRESKTEIGRWSSWINAPDAFDRATRTKWLRQSAAEFLRREKMFMIAFERDGGRLVAGTGYHGIDWDIPSFEIGYWVRTSATGRGYATEIASALLHYGFKALGANRVVIKHADGNDISRRVIAKTGIPYEGMQRNDTRRVDDSLGHSHIYAATSDDPLPALDVTWGQT